MFLQVICPGGRMWTKSEPESDITYLLNSVLVCSFLFLPIEATKRKDSFITCFCQMPELITCRRQKYFKAVLEPSKLGSYLRYQILGATKIEKNPKVLCTTWLQNLMGFFCCFRLFFKYIFQKRLTKLRVVVYCTLTKCCKTPKRNYSYGPQEADIFLKQDKSLMERYR